MKTKEAKGSALKEGLKKYVSNLTGKSVRESKKTRDALKAQGAKDTSAAWKRRDDLRAPGGSITPGSFEDHIMSNRALSIQNRARFENIDADKAVRSLIRSRDKARAGTALAVGTAGGGVLLAKKKLKGKEKKAKALKEGLKKFVGNLTGKRVREAKEAGEALKAKGKRESHAAWTRVFQHRGDKRHFDKLTDKARAVDKKTFFDAVDSDIAVRNLTKKRDLTRGGTALAVGVGGGALLASKKGKGSKKTASVELISPMTLISMREEFDSIFEKEAEQVQHKVTKAGLVKSIKSKISR